MHMRRIVWWLCLALVAVSVALPAGAQEGRPERSRLVLAVGGKEALVYLPLTVAERLGYLRETGIQIDIQNFAGGGQALRALVGGSADVVSGFYDHTIQMQAQGRDIRAFVMQQRYPGLVLAVTKAAYDAGVRSFLDLRGKRIGVTAPGSSTHFFVNFLMTKAGASLGDFSVIGIGAGATAVAAVRNRQVDALANVDPVISLLETGGEIVVLADTRTTTGTLRTFGGPYPAACLYATGEFIERNPNTVQALTLAMVKALQWIRSRHSVEEIVNLMPPEYYQGNREVYTRAVKNMLPSYSPDGRMLEAGPPNVLRVLSQFDPQVSRARIDLSKTYETRFVEAALKQLRGK
jgi:NitT/TauT family transport system substrate-binding protein